jgi:hypothetical protein
MEKTTNNQLLPAGTGPERAPISKVCDGPVPAGKKTSPVVPTGDCPNAEVPQRPVRRSFLADYKLQILQRFPDNKNCRKIGTFVGKAS